MSVNNYKGMINDHVSPLTSEFQELVLSMSRLNARLHNEHALRHATHGIGRRLAILRVNVKHILRLSERPKDAPLYGEAQNELGMHLNSFYIHLRGLLDNLAWMLAYELQLFGPLSEDNTADRKRIGLFQDDFRKTLKHGPTTELVARHVKWHSMTKQLRDPIAHRVPLYAVPCVLTEDEGKLFHQLNEQELQALLAGDLPRYQQLHGKKLQLGEYHPVFCLEEEGEPIMGPIKEQIEQDSRVLIEILWHFIEDEKATQPAGKEDVSPAAGEPSAHP